VHVISILKSTIIISESFSKLSVFLEGLPSLNLIYVSCDRKGCENLMFPFRFAFTITKGVLVCQVISLNFETKGVPICQVIH